LLPIALYLKGMNTIVSNARAATLDELLKVTIPAFLSPPPSRDTLRGWFDEARIPRFKSNPSAKRGGGPCYYQVAGVEKLLRSKMLPGKMIAA
jgi:hypothetical protein